MQESSSDGESDNNHRLRNFKQATKCMKITSNSDHELHIHFPILHLNEATPRSNKLKSAESKIYPTLPCKTCRICSSDKTTHNEKGIACFHFPIFDK